MTRIPQDRSEMISVMREALTAGGVQREIDDEHLVLLATGRIDEIEPKTRKELLIAVSQDPQLAAVVAQMASLGLEPALGLGPQEHGDSIGDHLGRLHIRRFQRVVRMAWAASIVVLVGLLAWRFADGGASVPELGNPMSPSDFVVSDSRWQSDTSQATATMATGLETALVAVGVLCMILAVVSLWPLDRGAQQMSSVGDRDHA